jgi:hypothetical protein
MAAFGISAEKPHDGLPLTPVRPDPRAPKPEGDRMRGFVGDRFRQEILRVAR